MEPAFAKLFHGVLVVLLHGVLKLLTPLKLFHGLFHVLFHGLFHGLFHVEPTFVKLFHGVLREPLQPFDAKKFGLMKFCGNVLCAKPLPPQQSLLSRPGQFEQVNVGDQPFGVVLYMWFSVGTLCASRNSPHLRVALASGDRCDNFDRERECNRNAGCPANGRAGVARPFCESALKG